MVIVARRQAMRALTAALGFGCMLSVTGCDYWPPALQAQIEQMRAEIQTATTEKSQLQSQVGELLRAKQELLTQVDELNRLNRDKSTVITNLQHQLEAARGKASKTTASSKTAAKATAPKNQAKQPVKKKTSAKH